tara:strand:- start:9770 stop:9985 length:216 start_codon:yes stop_codon:yes gene_type:complete
VCFDGVVSICDGADFLGHGGFVEGFGGAWDFGLGFDELVEFAADGSGLLSQLSIGLGRDASSHSRKLVLRL